MKKKDLKSPISMRPTVVSKREKKEEIFNLIDVIETKVATLKHGYIAENEFGQLKLLVSRL